MSTILYVSLVVGIPMAILTIIAFIADAALAADARRREAESSEYVMWVEEGWQ